ncbi:hypothetical protein [Arthrobacter dokdonensis]|uniref:hypothetical protein n=1 Tax=Arthrobacter dokdonellae TaxID=2211210 RepID=UPI001013C982|nr:hypothetical protein [Arthrobacter dokdonellae]
MRTNPMVKPQTSSGWAVTLSVISCVCLIVAVRLFTNQPAAWTSGLVFMAVTILPAGGAAAIWIVKMRRTKTWITNAIQQWEHFAAAKSCLGVTTEITVLDIHSLDPTGTWITIRWDKFGHVQRAWMEAIPDEIWRGSVLLISPDPAQIQVHGPWPEIYYLMAANYHAFASADALPYFRDPKYRVLAKGDALRT